MTKGSISQVFSLFTSFLELQLVTIVVSLVAAAKSGLDTTGTKNLCPHVQRSVLPIALEEIC